MTKAKKNWAGHVIVARMSLLLVLVALVRWSGTPYEDSIDDRGVSRGGDPSSSLSQSRRWQ
jgi:hypothetical protein